MARQDYVLESPGGPFRIDYAKELNPQQLDVVMAGGGPLLVIAGAGSGKTRTLTYRVARLIESGVPPGAILLLTFTNKAAREMLHRTEMLLGGAVSVTGGTFHHAGHLALRRFPGAAGLPKNFTIVDRDDAEDLIEDVAGSVVRDRDKRFPKGEVLLDIVSMSVNTGKSIEEVVAQKYEVHGDLVGEFGKIAAAYEKKKRDVGVVDFDDLLTRWVRMLDENEEVRGEFQRRWAHILVDEYQDTNLLQARLTDRLAEKHRNIMVVGDDAQSIYSFRGANFANIIDFKKRYDDAKMFKLEINYRSSPEILALSNASIAHNRLQYAKELTAQCPPGPPPAVVPLERPEEQAAFVAQRIRELEDEGVPLGEIAVLYRSHWLALELQLELARKDIPFEVRSGLRFFEQAHVKDATSWLRIAVNPRDEPAWKRVLRLHAGVGKVTADKVWHAIEASKDPLDDLRKGAIKAPKAANTAIEALRRTMDVLLAHRDRPWDQLRSVLEGGYQQHLYDTYENAAARVQDLLTLADFSRKFTTTESFLSDLALMSNVAEFGDPGAPAEQRVVLSTVHQAKGLEWTAVFVLWLVDGRFPDARALGEMQEEEERRLFYVACTRARRHLFLTFPVMAREGQFAGVIQRRSRFIEELPEDLYTLLEVKRRPFGRPRQDDEDRWMDGESPYDE